MSISTQISALQTAKTNIRAAIQTKGVTVPSTEGFSSFASRISSITQLSTADATASEADILNGKTAYGSAGTKLTGSLQVITVRNGTSTPSNSLGSDGDLYLLTY